MASMQRRLISRSFLTLFTLGLLSVATTSACKGDKGGDADKTAAKTEPQPVTNTEGGEAGPVVDIGKPTPAGETTGAVAEPAGTTTGTVEVAPPPVDIPALLAKVKDLKTADEDALEALDEAMTASADKIEAAKIANGRGEALVNKGEADRATAFFEWSKATHTLYAEPVFNLAKGACLAGDADECKELLLEVKKRGNKKLLKQIGIDPIFTPVQDDPEVRKLYEG